MPLTEICVAIGIVFWEGRLLICRRRQGDSFGGLWEFPGGKREEGETVEQCLRRELREEVGIEVEVIESLRPIHHRYPTVAVTLHPIICRLSAGRARALSASELLWIWPAELSDRVFPEANAGLIRELAQRDWSNY